VRDVIPNERACSLAISDSTIDRNQAIGGANEAGGNGADGRGGGLATHLGGTIIASNCTVRNNLAVGGAGRPGGYGGNGQGGGLYNDGSTALGVSSLQVTGSTIIDNDADGGAAGVGKGDGQSLGGGLYLASGGSVCLDTTTIVKKNHASTSNDDIFGVFTTCN
jgi:large repetitive protein